MERSMKIPPYFLAALLGRFRTFLAAFSRRIFPASVVLYEQFQNFWLMQPLYIAAELDIATLLKPGLMGADELAASTGMHPDALYRVLRTLSANGIFRELPGKKFCLNSRAKTLLETDGSMRNVILQHLGKINWDAFSGLTYTVRSGENAFRKLYGTELYPYLREHPGHMAVFEKSMSELSALAAAPILARYDFSGFRTVADIGGGEGHLMLSILGKYKSLHGMLFDLPENEGKVREIISHSGLEARLSFYQGNFMDPLNIRADAYILKNVLHNWSDEQCKRILSNLRHVMDDGSKLLILEMVLPGRNRFNYASMLDMQMLATMPGGRERTRGEFTGLLKHSGLRLNRVIRTVAPLCILEAVGE